MSTLLLPFAVIALGAAVSAGTFSVSGPGGAIPDFTSGAGLWNTSYSGPSFASTATLANPVTSVSALRLLGFQHSWRGDLHVLLRAPNGVAFNVVVRPGSDGWTAGDTGNYLLGDYTFVDVGGASVHQGNANIGSGTYDAFPNTGPGMWTLNASTVPLASIAGPAGVWTLEIRDWAGSDTGSLGGWTLEGTDAPPAIASFCAGDGALSDHTTPCPCGNNGASGNGCGNSAKATGARLAATGTPASNDVVLRGTDMLPTVLCIYLQGDALVDAVFGDGVRCTGGTLLRLRAKGNSGGASSFPDATDSIALSARGGVAIGSGASRYYQAYYRNSAPAYCPPDAFNVTNGLRIDW